MESSKEMCHQCAKRGVDISGEAVEGGEDAELSIEHVDCYFKG